MHTQPNLTKAENEAPKPNSGITDALHTAYETMFKSFYRQPIPSMTLETCKAAVSLADEYGALCSVRDSICARLFEWDELDDRIEQNPLEFLLLGYKLESGRIFNEAFTHVVGMRCGELDKLTFSPWCSDSNVPASVLRSIDLECGRLNKLLLNAMRECLRVPVSYDGGDSVKAAFILLRLSLSRCFSSYGAAGSEGLLFRQIARGPKPLDSDINWAIPYERVFLPIYQEISDQIKSMALVLGKNNLRSKKYMNYLTCAEPLKDTGFPWQL